AAGAGTGAAAAAEHTDGNADLPYVPKELGVEVPLNTCGPLVYHPFGTEVVPCLDTEAKLSMPNVLTAPGEAVEAIAHGIARDTQSPQSPLEPGATSAFTTAVGEQLHGLSELTRTRPDIEVGVTPQNIGMLEDTTSEKLVHAHVWERPEVHSGFSAVDTAVEVTAVEGYNLAPELDLNPVTQQVGQSTQQLQVNRLLAAPPVRELPVVGHTADRVVSGGGEALRDTASGLGETAGQARRNLAELDAVGTVGETAGALRGAADSAGEHVRGATPAARGLVDRLPGTDRFDVPQNGLAELTSAPRQEQTPGEVGAPSTPMTSTVTTLSDNLSGVLDLLPGQEGDGDGAAQAGGDANARILPDLRLPDLGLPGLPGQSPAGAGSQQVAEIPHTVVENGTAASGRLLSGVDVPEFAPHLPVGETATTERLLPDGTLPLLSEQADGTPQILPAPAEQLQAAPSRDEEPQTPTAPAERPQILPGAADTQQNESSGVLGTAQNVLSHAAGFAPMTGTLPLD
uniref:hypothetical protein n=1 Tax=Actinoalloteichus spitiensis TaxID=252394 RepID=UPI000585ADFD